MGFVKFQRVVPPSRAVAFSKYQIIPLLAGWIEPVSAKSSTFVGGGE